MIDSSLWTGRRGGRHSWAADLYRITPRSMWAPLINADAVVLRAWPKIVLTATAMVESYG